MDVRASEGHLLPCLTALLLAGVACGSDATGTPACAGSPGGITDLSAEPNYSATYLHRWTMAGCQVRLDVLMTRTAGCGPEDMLMGNPLGTPSENGAYRIYVRGDTTGLGGGATGYDAAGSLPAAAADTGFRQDTRELWMIPDDDRFVFIRYANDGHVEAWPRDPTPIGCA